jgi:hypothetical protein
LPRTGENSEMALPRLYIPLNDKRVASGEWRVALPRRYAPRNDKRETIIQPLFGFNLNIVIFAH